MRPKTRSWGIVEATIAMTSLTEFQKVGTIETWVNPPLHPSWATNSDEYRFPPLRREGIEALVTKHPDRTIEIEVNGPLGGQYQIREPIPKCDERGLFIVVTWGNMEVTFFLNGAPVKTFTI